MTEVLITAVARGVTALLRGCINGTDHDRLLSSAEPGLESGLGVPALILGTFTNALHAVSAAVLVITSVPEHYLNLIDQLLLCLIIEQVILPFVTSCLDPMLCLIFILLFWDFNNEQRDGVN